MIVVCMIIYPLAMNKDFLNGKSLGKRIFGIQVQNLVNKKTSEWKNALRNFLLIIPIDMIFTIFSPTSRIGDKIAKSKVGFENELNLKTINKELKNYQINEKLIFGLIFGIINIYGLLYIYGIIFSKI